MAQIRSERFRQQLLRFVDGDARLTHAAFHLNNMKHGEQIVDWLLIHGFKGKRFFDWQAEKHRGSVIEVVKFVIAQVNHTNGVKPIVVGGEYLAR